MGIEQKCINTIRVLAADIVQKSNSGHPGAPMGLAVVAYTLWSLMNYNPANPRWINRDRFVLSNGHACALQYIMLHLTGYDLSLEDLRNFRQLKSKTPGHPENHSTPGIEVTTGPLGQGFANGVGIAIAQKNINETYSKESNLFNSKTFVFCGDGCLQEGVCCEAASLAGHLQLDNLIVLYDDNKIQIDGDTNLAFTEDVDKRFEALNWHCQSIEDGDSVEAADKIKTLIENCNNVKGQPHFIRVRTTIGFGSKNQGKEKVHGAALGNEDIAELKKKWGFDPSKTFHVDDDVKKHFLAFKERGMKLESEWNAKFENFKKDPKYNDFKNRYDGKLDPSIIKLFPKFDLKTPLATRKTSEMILSAIVPKIMQIVGGSADLTGSNLTRWKEAIDFQPPSLNIGDYSGRYLRFGVREHSMAAICNGISSFQPPPHQTDPHHMVSAKSLDEARVGFFIPFAATFLNFITYAHGAVRLSALSGHQVIYIMTHDSIGLGEDGPTHQPIETLALLRALPNCSVWRPADGNETSAAYLAALLNTHTPTVLCLSRQNLPQLDSSSIDDALKGAYHVVESKEAKAILVATGSEVPIALEASKLLKESQIHVSVVSMPSMDYFEKQDQGYKNKIFPSGIPVISIEAMATLPWARYAHSHLGIDTFGASGPYTKVYEHFGITSQNLVTKVKGTIAFYQGKSVPNLFNKP